MSDGDHSDTLSTISTVSSLTSSDRLDSPPPYSPPRIYAESKSSRPADDESLSSTLITASSSTRCESSISSPCPVAVPDPVPQVRSPPMRRKNIRRRATNRSYEDDSSNHSNRGYNNDRSSPRARPPRIHDYDHPPHSPMASSPPPLPLIPSLPPPPSSSSSSSFPPPPAPDPPANMYMGANPWMHPAQGFSIYQSASPSGASQSISFHGPAMPQPRFVPQNYYPPNIPDNFGMGGMEGMRRGMEDMRRTMQHDMAEMRNSMRQAQFEMNSTFHGGRSHRRTPRRANNSVFIGNQAYGADGPDGTFVINNGRARGHGMNSVNGIQVGQGCVVLSGGGPGSYAVSVSSTGGGQAVSQTYVGNDGSRYTYNAYQGL